RRADIFALGATLYECLTQERLFRGDDDLETLRLVREAKVWPPSSVRPEIDPDIDAIVLKMLAHRPQLRYQTCQGVPAAVAPIVHRLHADAELLSGHLKEVGPAPREAAHDSVYQGERGLGPHAATTPQGKRSTLAARRLRVVVPAAALVVA